MDINQFNASEEAITNMCERLFERYGNAIYSINLIDFNKATLADYINGIDATMIDCTGNTHKLQFKSRQTGNDICIELAVIPHMTAISYYDEINGREFLVNTKSADIFVQQLNNGTTFVYSALQLHIMAQYQEFWDNPIHRNKEGQYLLFINREKFRNLLLNISNEIIG